MADPTPDPVELIDAADRRLFEATKGTAAVHDAARVIAALRAVLSPHVSTPYQPSGGNDPDRCRVCGTNPSDGKHPADENGIAFGGYYRCANTPIKAVCEYCADEDDGYRIHAWPCGPVSTVIHALTKDQPKPAAPTAYRDRHGDVWHKEANDRYRLTTGPGVVVSLPDVEAQAGPLVTLTACDWVLWSPCGCPRAVTLAQYGDTVLTTADKAWEELTPDDAERDSERRFGYRIELVTHERYSAEIYDQMRGPCPHKTT